MRLLGFTELKLKQGISGCCGLGGCGEMSTCQRPGGKPWKTLVSKNNQKIERLKAGSVGFGGCVFRILGMDDLWCFLVTGVLQKLVQSWGCVVDIEVSMHQKQISPTHPKTS